MFVDLIFLLRVLGACEELILLFLRRVHVLTKRNSVLPVYLHVGRELIVQTLRLLLFTLQRSLVQLQLTLMAAARRRIVCLVKNLFDFCESRSSPLMHFQGRTAQRRLRTLAFSLLAVSTMRALNAR